MLKVCEPSGIDFKATLKAENTSKGEEWNCSIRTYDGTDCSDWVYSDRLITDMPSSLKEELPSTCISIN